MLTITCSFFVVVQMNAGLGELCRRHAGRNRGARRVDGAGFDRSLLRLIATDRPVVRASIDQPESQ